MYNLQEKFHVDNVSKAACSSDGKWAVLFSLEHRLNVLNLETGESRSIEEPLLGPSLPEITMMHLDFVSNDSLVLVVGYMPSKHYMCTLLTSSEGMPHWGGAGGIWDELVPGAIDFRFERTNRILTILYAERCLLINLRTQQEAGYWQLVNAALGSDGKPRYCWSNDSKLFAIARNNSTIAILNSMTGQLRNSVSMPGNILRPLAFFPEANYLLGSNVTTPSLCVWNVMTGECTRTIPIASIQDISLVFLANGRQVLYYIAGQYFFWNFAGGDVVAIEAGSASTKILSTYCSSNDFAVLEDNVLRVLGIQEVTSASLLPASTLTRSAASLSSMQLELLRRPRAFSSRQIVGFPHDGQPFKRSLSESDLSLVIPRSLESIISIPPQPAVQIRAPSPPQAILSPLATFLQMAYSGHYGTNADNLLKLINQCFRTELNAEPMLAEHWQLQFLYICVSEIYLQNPCRRRDCVRFNLPHQHSIIDHLKKIFFEWAKAKYTNLGWVDRGNNYNEDSRLTSLLSLLVFEHPAQAYDNDAVLGSMTATLLPFIKTPDDAYSYDISGLHSNYYQALHKFQKELQPHPYVRLGGELGGVVFILDCHEFDMRGADLAGNKSQFTLFYDDWFALLQSRRHLPEMQQELSTRHVNFVRTDLRYADLRKTKFNWPEALVGARFNHAKLGDSEIKRFLPHNSCCTIL